MTFTRRRARAVALALFLVGFVGPWGKRGGVGETSWLYFPELVERMLKRPLSWPGILVALFIAVPVTCLATIPRPPSRRRVIVYRVLGAGTLAYFCAVLLLRRPPLEAIVEPWGFALYTVALLFALFVEVVPIRGPPKRDFAEVFR